LQLGAADFLTKPLDVDEVALRIHNMLETRRLHRALQDITQSLEARVDERTRELIEAREVALTASRLKSDFLATISHELRTPLVGVVGMSGLLLETELSTEQQEFAGVIQQSAQELQSIVDNILDFVALEAGSVTLRNDVVDVRSLVSRAVAMYRSDAETKGLALYADVAPDILPTLQGDPVRLTRVIDNLLNNAVKFTSHGSVAVKVTAEHTSPLRQVVRFTIRDTGIGFSDAMRARLFESFMQADSSTTRRYRGVGLGLIIAKRLVEMMDGTIGVDSVEGTGSTFWFSVALSRDDVHF
jgi:signal transduction histidine kinase